MKNLLLNEYPAHFGANGNYTILSVEKQGVFPLNDEKACRECRGQNKQSTVEKLCEVPAINERMNGYATKEGIFACRIKPPAVPIPPGSPGAQMFLNSIPKVKGYTNIAYGFKFRMLEYPETYEW